MSLVLGRRSVIVGHLDHTAAKSRISMQRTQSSSELSPKDAFDLYENGKHRRYSLLFAVNGASFAIAKLLVGEEGKSGVVLGNLTLPELSLGMAALTAILVWDIWVFGEKMRMRYLRDAFGREGKIVLILLGALLCLGWLLAGMGRVTGA